MRSDPEPTPARDTRSPLTHVAFRDLLNTAAGLADEVVVMLDRAQPVPELHRILPQYVDDAVLGEHPKRAVHGREPGAAAGVPQAVVQLLCRQRFATVERGEHLGALLGLASHATLPRARLRRASR